MSERDSEFRVVPAGHDFMVKPAESTEDKAHRHKLEVADADHRKHKELVLFYFAISTVGLSVVAAIHAIINRTPHADWGEKILAGLMTGLVGYLIGRKTDK